MTREATGQRRNEELPELSALDSLPLAVIATDLDGRVFYLNDTAQRLYGYSRTDALDASLILGVSHAVADAGKQAASVESLTDLGQITAELAGAGDASTVAHLVVDRAADAFGADSASLSVLEGDGLLHLLALRGGTADARHRFGTYPIDAHTPVGEAVSTGKIVTVTGSDEFQRRYPETPTREGDRSLIAAPLVVGNRRLGGISLSFDGTRPFGPNEVIFLQILADTTAQALARVDATADAVDRARKLAILAEAAVELAGSLDYQTTLTNVARLALDQLADWVDVELVEGDELRPVVTLHRDPKMVELAGEMRRRYPSPLDSPTGVPAVVRTGVSQLFEKITDETLAAGALDPEHLELMRRMRLESLMIVPLAARDRILGALVLVSSDPRRRYGLEDLAFAEDLARRAAVAIDNSELYSQTLDSSVRLQHALLPASVPAPAAWQIAVHYRPAGRTEIGGDFYDAIELADGRLLTVIGDVMGRGINAAAAMAQLRAAMRAYVAVDPEPGTVLTKLTEMFAFYRTGGLATLVVALADARRSTVTLACAGHLPVVVVRGGNPEIVVPPTSPPLGVGSFPRTSVSVPLEPGDAFLLYTDGLVETHEQDIDRGIDRLVRALRAGMAVTTDADLGALAAELVPSGQDDDVTLLAVSRRAAG